MNIIHTSHYRFGFDFWGLLLFLLTLPPCLAFILFAIDRKNLPAVVLAACFAVCHCVFGVVNFIGA